MRVIELLGDRRIRQREEGIPDPNVGEALIRITASAICAEAGCYTGEGHDPVCPGHEAVGIVEKINGSSGLQVGQQVNVHGVWSCGECEECSKGHFTWCENRPLQPGFHREYLAVPIHNCLPIPAEIDPVDAALLTGCAFGLAHGTAKKLGPTSSKTVAVFGVGPVGLSQVVMQTFLGAHVIAVDISPYRLNMAVECGATQGLNARDGDFADTMKELRPDCCIMCNTVPESLECALQVTASGGRIICIGEGLTLSLNVSGDLLRRDLSLIGHWFWFASDLPELLEQVWKTGPGQQGGADG